MSYIPPHKRHSKDPNRPSPIPDSLVTKSKNNLDFKRSNDKCNRVTFSENLLIDSNGIKEEVPSSAKLVPFSSDSVEYRNGERPLVLMDNDVQKDSEQEERTQWLLIADKVEEDIVLAYERAKTTMEENQHVLRLVVRFGEILLYRRQAGPLADFSQKYLKKMFSTDVPTSYLQHIKSKVVPSLEFSIDLEKETYTVKISHNARPSETINCKCILKEDGRLSMYKAELNVVWHLVVDMSCIDKNLDMRMMLAAKRKMTALTDPRQRFQRYWDLYTGFGGWLSTVMIILRRHGNWQLSWTLNTNSSLVRLSDDYFPIVMHHLSSEIIYLWSMSKNSRVVLNLRTHKFSLETEERKCMDGCGIKFSGCKEYLDSLYKVHYYAVSCNHSLYFLQYVLPRWLNPLPYTLFLITLVYKLR